MLSKKTVVGSAMACLVLAGCGSLEPTRYAELDSSAAMRAVAASKKGRIAYDYEATVNWAAYANVIFEPVVVYGGRDHQFGDMSEDDKRALANHMQVRFAEALAKRFVLVSQPGPATLRIRATLTGAATTTPVIGPLSRFDVGGAIYNGVQSTRDGEGSFTGAVVYAVEIHDATTHRLLSAFVAKQYPHAYDISANVGALTAAEVGLDKGAKDLLARLR